MPGMIDRNGARRSTVRPSAIMLPQVTRLGSPKPRKDSAASISTAAATMTAASETTGVSALGSTSRKAISKGRMPMTRAAATKSRSRRERISARVMRAGCIQAPMAMPSTMVGTRGPVTEMSASVSRKAGTVWKASATRISASSTQPPRKPAMVPTVMPMNSAAAAAAVATSRVVRAPWMRAERTSRPRRSVPRGWAMVCQGGRRGSPLMASGSPGASQGAASATANRIASMVRPARPSPVARRRNSKDVLF